MTRLDMKTIHMTAADLGAPNPLPPLGTLGEVQNIPAGPNVPDEMKENMKTGMRQNPLPYTVLDGYSRDKTERPTKIIVLENDFLKATFLPTYGGRLWSLYDKTAQRDLIYENPVIQPANLAIRNAWLSGGVEWNIGLRGHSPFTCSNVFAARVDGEEFPILRIYEYERIRQVPFAVDFILPSDSRVLFVYVRIANPHDHTVPMYWWSNIAYPEHPSTRVVAPADQAFRFGYGRKGLNLIDVPQFEGVDVSYSVNLNHSADFFFDIPAADRKWIAGIDGNGEGLFHTSTDRLLGRKLFLWGSGPGGNAWQTFLSVPGKPYIEIQAGLAHTQMEHIPMPAREQWSWIEAYGHVKTDPALTHGEDWKRAYTHVGEEIEKNLRRTDLEDAYRRAADTALLPVAEVLNQGSGWGFLEIEYRRVREQGFPFGTETDYSCDLETAQRQWLDLLETGEFPEPDPLSLPVGYEVEEKWRHLLEEFTVKQPDNWYAWLHLGLMHFAAGEIGTAEDAWEKSVAARSNPWALRNIAQLAALNGDMGAAVERYGDAFELAPTCIPLAVEYGRALLDSGREDVWLSVYDSLPEEVKQMGRFQLLYARGLSNAGRLDEALAVIEKGPQVTDLREGENSLTDIWYQIHEKKIIATGSLPEGDLREYVQEKFPPPAQIDFRMRTKNVTE